MGEKGTANLDAKTLAEEIKKALAERKTAYAEVLKAKDAKDEERTKNLLAIVEAKGQLLEELRSRAEEVKRHQDIEELQRSVEAMAAPQGKANGMSAPAQAVDHGREARELEDEFCKYMGGIRPSDVAMKTLTPKTQLREKAKGGICIPKTMLARAFPRTFGKDLLSRASAANNPSHAEALVPQEYIARLLMLQTETPNVIDMFQVDRTRTGELTWPGLAQQSTDQWGGVAATWISEGAPKPESEPTFEDRVIRTFELALHTMVGERLESRSAIDIEAFLRGLFNDRFDYTVEGATLTGGGNAAGQPLGVINTPNIIQVNRQTAGTVTFNDIVNLKRALRPAVRRRGVFIMGDDVGGALERTRDGENRPLFAENTSRGLRTSLVGYPFTETLQLPAMGNEGDIIFMDPNHYHVVLEEEVVMRRSDDAAFLENKIVFKVYTLVGGRLLEPQAAAILTGPGS